MTPRQTRMPRQWLIADERSADRLWQAVRVLPPGSGVLLLFLGRTRRERAKLLRRLRQLAATRDLTIVDGAGRGAARVHNVRELRRALLARADLILLSPVFATRSHPDWQPLERMRAGALARLGDRRLVALGGMNERRFTQVKRLGFQGWAGIDAFRT